MSPCPRPSAYAIRACLTRTLTLTLTLNPPRTLTRTRTRTRTPTLPLTLTLTRCVRVDAVWRERIRPALLAGKNVMVVSHGNTLRALVKLVDGVSDGDTYHLDLPVSTSSNPTPTPNP